MQLSQWSPYTGSDYVIVWQKGFASVWCWDKSRIDAEIQQHRRNPKAEQKIPETLLRAPYQDGLRLAKCLEGAEGQYWQDAQLVTSRWWPQPPSPGDWLLFQRDSGIPAERQESQVVLQELPLQAQPWARISNLAGSSNELPFAEFACYAALFLLLGLPTVYLGLQHLQITSAAAHGSAELANLKKTAAPLFEAREAALNSLTRLKAIYALDRYPEPLVLMDLVAQALPKDDAFVSDWEMTDNLLKITVNSPNGNIVGTTYVEALEKGELLSEVKVITNANPKLMTFAMTVLPLDSIDRKADVSGQRPTL